MRWIDGSHPRCGLDKGFTWIRMLILYLHRRLFLPAQVAQAPFLSAILSSPQNYVVVAVKGIAQQVPRATPCQLYPRMLTGLCDRHGHSPSGKTMKYGLSEGSTRGAMARSPRCTVRSGSFMSTASNGTRRTVRACPSAFIPATLL
jgi:hypothetical protein